LERKSPRETMRSIRDLVSWKLLAGPRRCWTVFSGDLAYQLSRPLFIVWH
jgi:hypothetical protein